jgi:hypothetical protein
MENAGTAIISSDAKQDKSSGFMDLPRGGGWYVGNIGFSISFGTVSATVGAGLAASRVISGDPASAFRSFSPAGEHAVYRVWGQKKHGPRLLALWYLSVVDDR